MTSVSEQVLEAHVVGTTHVDGSVEFHDHWMWAVLYKDETVKTEEELRAFRNIEWENANAFVLIPVREGINGPLPHVVVPIPEDDEDNFRVVFFRRRALAVQPTDETATTVHGVIHAVGWQKTVNGKNVQAVTFYHIDGTAHLHTDPKLISGERIWP